MAEGDKGRPMVSSTFGSDSESPQVEELAAYINRLTPASLEAISIFKKPETFTSLEVIGSFMDLGTDPKAAWCKTKSTSFTAA